MKGLYICVFMCTLVVTTTEKGCSFFLKSLFGSAMAVFMAIVGVVLVLCFCSALLRWNEVRYRKKGLPPGTMGWPVFGETTEFLKQGPNFMKNQRAR